MIVKFYLSFEIKRIVNTPMFLIAYIQIKTLKRTIFNYCMIYGYFY